jgi:integral membrane protein (TIGR01906 family)
VGILALAILPLLTPFFVHAGLDAASSEQYLRLDRASTAALSDRTVSELVFGPGTFAFPGPDGAPFYSAAEAAHLRDARVLLIGFLALGVLSLAFVGVSLLRGRRWNAVARGAAGLAVATVVIGVVGFFAFEPVFELFHQIFFPGGNWAFDNATSHMVQLYPYAFWELAAAGLGAFAIGIAVAVWLFARSRGRTSGTPA